MNQHLHHEDHHVSKPEPWPPAEPAGRRPAARLQLGIEGMTCASCVRRVEKALSRVPNVARVEVNFATERALVEFEPGASPEEASKLQAELLGAVEGAGYHAVPARTSAQPRRESRALYREAVHSKGTHHSARDKAPPAHSPGEGAVESPHEHSGHQAHREDLLIAGALTVPLLVLGMSHGLIPWAESAAGRAAQLVLASSIVFGPGRRFFSLAWTALRHRTAEMNTLVAVGSGAAYLYSAVAVLFPGLFPHTDHGAMPHIYFESAGAILTFMLLGHFLEAGAKKRLTDAVRGLTALTPKTAAKLTPGARSGESDGEETIPTAELKVGDRVRIRPGESVPADGRILCGSSALDESMLTGESIPVDKQPGDMIYGGTINQEGSLVAEVTQTGEATALSRIAEAVAQAQGSKAPIARLADQISAVFVPVVILLALATGTVWFALEPTAAGLGVALERFVTVLVIACPCALGLATPAAVAAGTGRAAELGVLIKGGANLEAASRIDTVFLDKTGTVTEGKPRLVEVLSLAPDEQEFLSLVGSLENESEHPLARAIARGALERGARLLPVEGFVASQGGVAGRVGEVSVAVGTGAFHQARGTDPELLLAAAGAEAEQGRTPGLVSFDGRLAGLVAVADRARPESREVIRELRRAGLRVALVTGDRREVAERVAAELGIDEIFPETRPEDKARIVRDAEDAGARVAMVGDGVNDAPSLAAATVGIAMGSGSDIAASAADMTLPGGRLNRVPVALGLAKRTMTTIRQNLFWAFIYNLAGIPLAAGVFFPFTGWLLSPVFASAAMALSSVSVLVNSLRLRRFGRTFARKDESR